MFKRLLSIAIALICALPSLAADYTIKAGSTSQSVYLWFPLGGGTPALSAASYIREGTAPVSALSTELAAVDSAYSSGKWKTMITPPAAGVLIRYDIPDAALASGRRSCTIVASEDSGDTSTSLTIDLVGYDPTAANLPANVTQLLGTAWLTPATAGTPDVNLNTASLRKLTGYSTVVWIATSDDAEAVIEAQTAPSLCILSAGTHAMGADALVIPNGVSVVGCGRDATVLTSTNVSTTLVKPGDNNLISDLTIKSLNTAIGNSDRCFGAASGSFNNVHVRNVRIVGFHDGIYIATASACSVRFENVQVESRQSPVICSGPHKIQFSDVEVRAFDDQNSGECYGMMLDGNGAEYFGNNVRIDIHASTSGGTVDMMGLRLTGNTAGRIVFENSSISLTGTASGSNFAVSQVTVPAAMVNCDFDRSKTFGTIADVRGVGTGGIRAASFADSAIDATAIAASAIGASELAADSIGASEIAASAITSSEAPNLDTNVGSRLQTGSYTPPPSAIAIRAEIDGSSTQLAAIKQDTTDTLEFFDGAPTFTEAMDAQGYTDERAEALDHLDADVSDAGGGADVSAILSLVQDTKPIVPVANRTWTPKRDRRTGNVVSDAIVKRVAETDLRVYVQMSGLLGTNEHLGSTSTIAINLNSSGLTVDAASYEKRGTVISFTCSAGTAGARSLIFQIDTDTSNPIECELPVTVK